MRRAIVLMAAVYAMHTPLAAQDPTLEAAHQELVELNRLEQERFISGDCDGLIELLSEDISFYANGRKLTRDGVGQLCARMPRPFSKTGEETTQIHMISADGGYVVKVMTFPGSDRIEVVTKVWRRGASGWRMVHLQSTVTDLKPRVPPETGQHYAEP